MSEDTLSSHGFFCFYLGFGVAFLLFGAATLLAFTGLPQGVQLICMLVVGSALGFGNIAARDWHRRRTLSKTLLDN